MSLTIDFDVYDDSDTWTLVSETAVLPPPIVSLAHFSSVPEGQVGPLGSACPGSLGFDRVPVSRACPPPCRSATSGAPGFNLGYLTDPRGYAARTAYSRCGPCLACAVAPAALRGRERAAAARARLLGPRRRQELRLGRRQRFAFCVLVAHRQHARDGLAHDADLGELPAAPPVTLATRSCASSFFSSSSVFSSSLLFLVRSSCP